MKKIKRFNLKTYDFFRRNRLRKKYFKSISNHTLTNPWQIAIIKVKQIHSKNRFRVEASLLFGKKRKRKTKASFNSKIKIKRKVYSYLEIIRYL